MTRKDYLNIAAAIRATQERIKASRFSRDPARENHVYPVNQDEQLRGVRRAAAHICDALVADNPQHFDPVQFLRNCGYGAAKTGVTAGGRTIVEPRPWTETMGSDPAGEMARKLHEND